MGVFRWIGFSLNVQFPGIEADAVGLAGAGA
jgi:hypothetical protein